MKKTIKKKKEISNLKEHYTHIFILLMTLWSSEVFLLWAVSPKVA
jgi:hypothetical protein